MSHCRVVLLGRLTVLTVCACLLPAASPRSPRRFGRMGGQHRPDFQPLDRAPDLSGSPPGFTKPIEDRASQLFVTSFPQVSPRARIAPNTPTATTR